MDIQLITDHATLDNASTDFGRLAYHRPKAIFRPDSPEAIAKLIRFAIENGLKVVPQGQRHSTGGQSQGKRI